MSPCVQTHIYTCFLLKSLIGNGVFFTKMYDPFLENLLCANKIFNRTFDAHIY
jgi:hypothetical protein